MNLGLAIKISRQAAGFNAKRFSEEINVSSSYLSLLESGKRDPSISTLADIARVLGVDISDLFSVAEKIEKPANKAEKLRKDISTLVTLALKIKHGT